MNFEFYADFTTPWSREPPHIATLLGAAADGCSDLRSIALSGIGLGDHRTLGSRISRLSRLTSLALNNDFVSALSEEMTALTSLQRLSLSTMSNEMRHALAALPTLHALQVTDGLALRLAWCWFDACIHCALHRSLFSLCTRISAPARRQLVRYIRSLMLECSAGRIQCQSI